MPVVLPLGTAATRALLERLSRGQLGRRSGQIVVRRWSFLRSGCAVDLVDLRSNSKTGGPMWGFDTLLEDSQNPDLRFSLLLTVSFALLRARIWEPIWSLLRSGCAVVLVDLSVRH